MTEIIENQSQNLVVQMGESFDQFASRVYGQSKRGIHFKDGTQIELNPNLAYSFLMLGMERLKTNK